MTWEYSGDPSTSTKDEVRFLIGDTNDADQQLQDEEVEYLIAEHGSATGSAVAALRVLGSRYSTLAVKSKAVGDLRIEYTDRSKAYMDLADSISGGATAYTPIPQATGILVADKLAADQDPDRVQPNFKIGRDDYPMHDPDESVTKEW